MAGGPAGSSSTRGCTPSAGRATGRSRSCSSTQRWPRTTSSTRSTATSPGPAQALAYKLGQLEIQRLSDEARARLGGGFDIRAFHDAVLREGALPLTTLRTVVEAATQPG